MRAIFWFLDSNGTLGTVVPAIQVSVSPVAGSPSIWYFCVWYPMVSTLQTVTSASSVVLLADFEIVICRNVSLAVEMGMSRRRIICELQNWVFSWFHFRLFLGGYLPPHNVVQSPSTGLPLLWWLTVCPRSVDTQTRNCGSCISFLKLNNSRRNYWD